MLRFYNISIINLILDFECRDVYIGFDMISALFCFFVNNFSTRNLHLSNLGTILFNRFIEVIFDFPCSLHNNGKNGENNDNFYLITISVKFDFVFLL